MEGVVNGDELEFFGMDLAAVSARHLERAFDRLRAGVREEAAIEAAGAGDSLRQPALILVIVKIGGVQNQRGLFANHLGEPGMGISQRVHANAGDQIEVPVAGGVLYVTAFAAMQDQRVAGVVLDQKLLFEIDDIVDNRRRGGGGFHVFIINSYREDHAREKKSRNKSSPGHISRTGQLSC